MKNLATSRYRDIPTARETQREYIANMRENQRKMVHHCENMGIRYQVCGTGPMPPKHERLRWGKSKAERIASVNTHLIGADETKPIQGVHGIVSAEYFHDTMALCRHANDMID